MSQNSIRILTIDDNEQIHSDFRRSLLNQSPAVDDLAAMENAMFGPTSNAPVATNPSYSIDSALQGEAGLNLLKKAIQENDRYAVAFVDMRMPPGWDGLQTIEELWKVDADLQVVICTAYSDYSWDEITARLGRTDRLLILRKPFDPVEVCQMAASLSEKRRLTAIAHRKQAELEEMVKLRTAQLEESLKQDRLRLDLLESLVEQRTSELRHAALHDKLTGLPNRSMISDRLSLAVRRCENSSTQKFAVMFLDLDDFKLVNDTMGHEAGDQLLRAVTNRITNALRAGESFDKAANYTAARLGGDEFVVLLENLTEYTHAETIAQRILLAVTQPYEVFGKQVRCGVSIGITNNEASYSSVEQLLRDADIAMYQAKAEKNCFVTFHPEMHSRVVARVSLEDELRTALKRNEFELYYQPVVSLSTGELDGFEALLRWNHPERGLVNPEEFIPLAEATGLIRPIGLYVFEQAARQVAAWSAQFPNGRPSVNINLSPQQLGDLQVVQQFRDIIANVGVDPARINLEVTEGFLSENTSLAEEILRNFRAIGMKTYIDDFGMGHSSLGRLPKLPIDGIKIDRVFLRDASEKRKYTAIVNAIINLSHHVDATIVAEGIESADQVALLQALDCDRGQGYYFSQPVPAARAERFFTETWRLQQAA